jgi:hypothetical protein
VHTFSEIVLEATGQVTQMAHATCSCCLPPDGLHTPVVCQKGRKKRRPTAEIITQFNNCEYYFKTQTAI